MHPLDKDVVCWARKKDVSFSLQGILVRRVRPRILLVYPLTLYYLRHRLSLSFPMSKILIGNSYSSLSRARVELQVEEG